MGTVTRNNELRYSLGNTLSAGLPIMIFNVGDTFFKMFRNVLKTMQASKLYR